MDSSNKKTMTARIPIVFIGLIPVLLGSFLRFYDLSRVPSGLSIYPAISRNVSISFENWFYPSMFVDTSILADKSPFSFGCKAYLFRFSVPVICHSGYLPLRSL